MKATWLSAAVLATALQVQAAQDARPSVTVHLDQTAVWVGDVVRYTVRAVHAADVQMVTDNFKKELLPVAPFVLRGVDIRRHEWAGGKQALEIELLLANYETGKTEITIPPLQLYYFKQEPGLARKEAPVESVTVPAVKLGLRSTLVPARPAPREAKAPPRRGLAVPSVLLALGVAGLLALAGYAGWRLWKRLHPDEASRQLTRQARERIVQEALARVRADVAAAGDDARRASAAIAAALRGLVGEIFQIPAPALTPEELHAALASANVDPGLAGEIKTVLAQCEALAYGKAVDGAAKERPRAQLLKAAEGIMRSPRLLAA